MTADPGGPEPARAESPWGVIEIREGDVLIMSGVQPSQWGQLEWLLAQHLGTGFHLIVVTEASHGPVVLRRAGTA